MPNKDFYLQPGNRRHALSILLHYAFWLACLMLATIATTHLLTIEANRSNPV